MKELRRRFDRFCIRNRNWGIPNLMLWVCLGAGLVYLISLSTNTVSLFNYLLFDRELILRGQVWRLISYPLAYTAGNPFLTLISLVCYYSLGRTIESIWGTLRFNLFYFTGIILMDAFCMIFGGYATVLTLNLSLLLAYATLFPDAQFIVLFIIPVKAWILAVIYLILMLVDVVQLTYPVLYFPHNLFPLISLANYFLFFGKNVTNIFPVSWHVKSRRAARKVTKPKSGPKTIPFPNAGSHQAAAPNPKAPYTHRCTVCGKTDVSHPQLEFRYCSRCKGYHCYCEDHISDHVHVE